MRFWHLVLGMIFVYLAMHVTIGLPKSIADVGRWVSLIVVAGIGALWVLPDRNNRVGIPPVFGWLIVLFLIVCLTATLAGNNVMLSALKWTALGLHIFVLIYVSNILVTPQQWNKTAFSLYVLLSCTIIFTLVLAVTGRDVFGWPSLFHQGRLAAIGNPNSVGIIALICGLLALWMRERIAPPHRWQVIGNYTILAAAIVALYWTGSRSSLAGFIVGALCWAFVTKKKMWPVVVACIMGGMLYLEGDALISEWADNISENYLRGDNLVHSRERIWEASIQSWSQQPWFGYGYGISGREYELVSLTSSVGSVRDGSGYFGVLESVGVAGTAVLFFLYAAVAFHLRRLARWYSHAKNHVGWWLSATGGTLFIALAVNAAGEPWIIGPGSFPHIMFWLSLGMTLAGMRFLAVAYQRTAAQDYPS